MSCEPEYTQYTICEWNVNLSNAKIHRNHRDQHLFEPGVNLMAKRQTDLTFVVHCSLVISYTTMEELKRHLSSRAECVLGLKIVEGAVIACYEQNRIPQSRK